MTWFLANWKKVAVGAAAGVALVGGLYLYNHLQEEREAEAAQALTALRASADRTASPSADEFRKVISSYAGTDAARQALFLSAGALYDAGRFDEAKVAFEKFARENPKDALMSQAMLGSAACLEALKRPDEAITAYQNVAGRFPNDPVNAPAKLGQARLLEAKGDSDAAYKIYQEMTRPDRASAWRMDFARRQDELLRRHPELAVTNAPPAPTPAAVPVPVPAPTPAPDKK